MELFGMSVLVLLLVGLRVYFTVLGAWTCWKLWGYDAGRFLVGLLGIVVGSVGLVTMGPLGLLVLLDALAVVGFASAFYHTFFGGSRASTQA